MTPKPRRCDGRDDGRDVPDDLQLRIESCADVVTLDRRLVRAASVSASSEVLEPCPCGLVAPTSGTLDPAGMEHRWITTAALLAWTLGTSACGSETGQGTLDTDASSSSTTLGLDSSSTADEPPPPPDEPSPPDAAQCTSTVHPPTDERVLLDVEIHCPRFALAADALSIVTDGESVYLGASYGRASGPLFRVDADGAESVPLAADVPTPPRLMLLDVDESLLVLSGLRTEGDAVPVGTWRFDGAWSREELFAIEEQALVGFARAGTRLDVWLRPRDDGAWEHRSSADGWLRSDVPLDANADPAVFGLSADGTPIALGVVSDLNGWSLWLGAETLDTGEYPSPRSLRFAQQSTTAALPQDAPAFVAITEMSDALYVYRPGQPAVALPDTAALVRQCSEQLECEETCTEDGTGRLLAPAAARTGDGTTWIAHVHAQMDLRLYGTDPPCGSVGSCECVNAVSSDESRLELRLTAIRPENNIEPMPPLPLLENDTLYSGLVMTAASQRLAIALRTDHGTLRALLVEP